MNSKSLILANLLIVLALQIQTAQADERRSNCALLWSACWSGNVTAGLVCELFGWSSSNCAVALAAAQSLCDEAREECPMYHVGDPSLAQGVAETSLQDQ